MTLRDRLKYTPIVLDMVPWNGCGVERTYSIVKIERRDCIDQAVLCYQVVENRRFTKPRTGVDLQSHSISLVIEVKVCDLLLNLNHFHNMGHTNPHAWYKRSDFIHMT